MNDWSNIQGHEQIKNDLRQLLAEKRLPHALLFTGIEGIGKNLTAKVLAKVLLCSGEEKPCNICPSCRAFDAKNHPDFYYLEPEGKANNIKIEQIRQMQSQIALSPYLADKRIVIINDAETMNEAAENSLLKTLEEPTGDVVFILVTANKDLLLPTILSRCMKLYFAPLSEDEIKIILKSKYAVNEDKATVIAKLSGGSMKRAISFLDDDNFNLCQNAMDFLSKDLNAKDIWQISDEFSAMDKAKIKQWADFLQMIIRDLLLLQAGADDNLLYNRDKKDVLDKLIVNFSLNRLFNCQNLIENLVKRLSSNADLKLMMQDFMLSWREQK
ncbi:DNA polymerase III subunit delta' [Megamonas hypermegale]|uniref:DNA polymerase III subunit delta' n=1 Tax=Megamonas hypermegale TaxID=158847 RepID=UPI00195B1D05|nr:DNA polymerase III subunit delta' [Megamonas hypermegale]MBM6760390.1 DNA polymerase III subunit delta' [Megamonas hypermegale]